MKILSFLILLILIIAIIFGVFLFLNKEVDEDQEADETGDSQVGDSCVTNDDCNFQTEQCENGVCVPWNPLG